MSAYTSRAWIDPPEQPTREDYEAAMRETLPDNCPICKGSDFDAEHNCNACGWWPGEPDSGWMYGA